jgi:hypothetical protein
MVEYSLFISSGRKIGVRAEIQVTPYVYNLICSSGAENDIAVVIFCNTYTTAPLLSSKRSELINTKSRYCIFACPRQHLPHHPHPKSRSLGQGPLESKSTFIGNLGSSLSMKLKGIKEKAITSLPPLSLSRSENSEETNTCLRAAERTAGGEMLLHKPQRN